MFKGKKEKQNENIGIQGMDKAQRQLLLGMFE
jgi:hypothetical protein